MMENAIKETVLRKSYPVFEPRVLGTHIIRKPVHDGDRIDMNENKGEKLWN